DAGGAADGGGPFESGWFGVCNVCFGVSGGGALSTFGAGVPGDLLVAGGGKAADGFAPGADAPPLGDGAGGGGLGGAAAEGAVAILSLEARADRGPQGAQPHDPARERAPLSVL